MRHASDDYVADEWLYLNSKGEVVRGNDPDQQTLLVAPNGHLARAKALRYGLITETPVVSEAPAPEPTAANTRAVTDEATGEVVASITEDEPEPSTKAQTAPPRTKAQAGPQGTK